MNRGIIIIILAFIVIGSFSACEPTATFNEPQPTNTDALTKIPRRLEGNYRNLKNNSTLTVSDSLIRIFYSYDYKIHHNQLDSNLKLSGDTLLNLKTGEWIVTIKDGDSLRIHSNSVDTLFNMNADDVLKRFKGYYFINTRHGTDGWVVKKIELSKGKLTIGSISAKTDIDNLKTITESRQDTIPPYRFVATRKQFQLFIKGNGFGETETFVRQ